MEQHILKGAVDLSALGQGCHVYRLRNESGEGTITMHCVFPGVVLAYNDFHMRYYDSVFQPGRSLFCIDHCREGRLEYAVKTDAYSYVGAGDLKLDRRLAHTGRFEMPLAHYHGAMVAFDLETACRALPEEIKGFPVALPALQAKFCPGREPVVLHGLAAVEHIFGELYAVPQQIRQAYFKIKILELLLYLDALELPRAPQGKPYYYKSQVEKVKQIRQYLADHMAEDITQEELSRRFGIALTPMKQCFKSVYGATIGGWLLQYRMNQAAVLLRTRPGLNVADIAGLVGYDSPSKFAVAFRRVMGIPPAEYRRRP